MRILAAIALDGRKLGRTYPGRPLAAPYRKSVAALVKVYDVPGGADDFITEVLEEVRSSLEAAFS